MHIASHPGAGVEEMIDLAEYLKGSGYKPLQVQDFIPAPMDIATCMYHTGLDPMTMKPVTTVKKLSDRKVQRALMQFFAPENYFTVHKALHGAGRKDLIGNGPQCLIPATPPREAIALQKQGKQPAGTRGTSGSKKSAFKKGKGYQGKNPKPQTPRPRLSQRPLRRMTV